MTLTDGGGGGGCPAPRMHRRMAVRGTLLLTTYVRCGPSSFWCLRRLRVPVADSCDQPERLAPLPAGAEPLEEDGDDAHGECRAIQACLHLVTSWSFLPQSWGT